MDPVDSGILRELRAAQAHMPASELAGQVKLSANALAGRIDELRDAGYDIEEHPHFGYKLISAPDRLIASDLAAMAGPLKLAREIVVFEKTDSTNDLAARRGHEGAGEGVVIFAETQLAGRGRLGRRWESNARQGLWFSMLLRPAFSMALWTRLTTWAAVAIAEAVEDEIPCRAKIKWPNDIYIEGKKAAGILIESHYDQEQRGFAVLGIGINVNQEHFPAELESKAVSLRMAAAQVLDRQKIVVAVLRKLDALYPQLESDFRGIVAAAEARSFLKGKWIEARAGQTIISGMAERLDEHGGLVLRLVDGSETTISSGEVTLAVA